jgi:hypothetical protein
VLNCHLTAKQIQYKAVSLDGLVRVPSPMQNGAKTVFYGDLLMSNPSEYLMLP